MKDYVDEVVDLYFEGYNLTEAIETVKENNESCTDKLKGAMLEEWGNE